MACLTAKNYDHTKTHNSMNNEILDTQNASPSKKNLIYTLGSILSIASLLIFMISMNILVSLLVSLIGTILIWCSSVDRKEKAYALIPFLGLFCVSLCYLYIFSS